MALSFPYPTIGTVIREPTEGCQSCVHTGYCPAYYWFIRWNQETPHRNTGRACESWSNDPADRIDHPPNADDLAKNEQLNIEGILTEKNRNGITAPTTGNAINNG